MSMSCRVKNMIRSHLEQAGWFSRKGAYLLVDGQFGSTGKGLAAAVLAETFPEACDIVTTNAGPNSGHTSYFGDEKIVLRQLPTYGVIARKLGHNPLIFVNAGAVVDPEVLKAEIEQYVPDEGGVLVSPFAAVVNDEAKALDGQLTAQIGSTGKGTGAALAMKVMRFEHAIAGNYEGLPVGNISRVVNRGLVEVSQGFSLGLNSGFYPYCTSRECTVSQAMSDAGIHPDSYAGAMMVVRTYPIRVAGNSGPGYPDQKEITWGELGVEPEVTTVTKKIRRVFTWSDLQFMAALAANRPDVIFLNFLNYLPKNEWGEFVETKIIGPYRKFFGIPPKAILLGTGPTQNDVGVWE